MGFLFNLFGGTIFVLFLIICSLCYDRECAEKPPRKGGYPDKNQIHWEIVVIKMCAFCIVYMTVCGLFIMLFKTCYFCARLYRAAKLPKNVEEGRPCVENA